jgi:uncharacterized damage-inducible protein DinB
MRTVRRTLVVYAALAALTAPVAAQTPSGAGDPIMAAARDAAGYMRTMVTKAAEQMSEEDYAFKPVPEVRSFGQLLAHVADTNYYFCARAQDQVPPVRGIEKTRTTKADIQKALAESFDYCDKAYASVAEGPARPTVEMGGQPRPPVVVLLFRTHHAALHYGNVATYMRLKGKVPPSSQESPKQ